MNYECRIFKHKFLKIISWKDLIFFILPRRVFQSLPIISFPIQVEMFLQIISTKYHIFKFIKFSEVGNLDLMVFMKSNFGLRNYTRTQLQSKQIRYIYLKLIALNLPQGWLCQFAPIFVAMAMIPSQSKPRDC